MQLDLNSFSFEDLCISNDDTHIIESKNNDIAIIGIGIHLPQADTLDAVWDNILGGVQSFRKIPMQRKVDLKNYWEYTQDSRVSKDFIKCAYLDDIDFFDPTFFNITPMEAKLMSPGQRLFLQCAWEAIEDAGYAAGQMSNSSTGVYLGLIGDMDTYQYKEMIHRTQPQLLAASMAGNLGSMNVGRLAYQLNLKGPAMLIDTACSSSLVAIDVACQALRNGQCDMALAGGVRVNLSPIDDKCYKIGIESSDSTTRTFDDTADGSGFGEGVVVMLLKPLSQAQRDSDYIHAIIKGSATNQDGKSSMLTAPNSLAQEKVLVKAWERAGILPENLSYFEAHGTGTKIGDIVELEAIKNAFLHFTKRKQFCAIGSYKTAIGHLYECAGITGLVRAVLALKYKTIPGTLGFNLPNSKVDFTQLPIYINERNRNWSGNGRPRLAAVSSFGISGTNCHVIVEEAPNQNGSVISDGIELFKLTAKSRKALENTAEKFTKYLRNQRSLNFNEICYSANIGRGDFEYRLMIISDSQKDLVEKLSHFAQGHLEENCFYGEHHTISENSEYEREFSITRNQKLSYTKVIEGCIDYLNTTKTKDIEQLITVAQNYISGGDISWNHYYNTIIYQRVPLPTYAFEKKRYWLEIPKVATKAEHFTFGMKWIVAEDKAYRAVEQLPIMILHSSSQGYDKKLKECFELQNKDVFEAAIGCIDTPDVKYKDCSNKIDSIVEELEKHKVGIVVYMGAFMNRADQLQNPEKGVNEGVMFLFHLSRKLQIRGLHKYIKIVILTQNAREVNGSERWLSPESALTIGFGKVLSQECNNICKVIDIDQYTDVENVAKEIQMQNQYYHVALRRNQRYVEQFEKKFLDEQEAQIIGYKSGGVYVITGGMGHIGLTFAKHIANQTKVNIILLNRTVYPERGQWADIINANKETKLVQKLQSVLEIEAMGSKVDICTIDICKQKETEKKFEDIRRRYGEINGIIHAAGLSGSGFIINKTVEDIEKVLEPKVQGSWVLHQVTLQDHLDFFVLCSSGVSIIGEIGQSDYTAANAYLDALAEYRNKLGQKTVAINWVVWKNARMRQGESAIIDGVFKTISSNEAMLTFENVINKKISNVLVGQMNLESPMIYFMLSDLSFKVSDEILDSLPKSHKGRSISEDYQKPISKSVRLLGRKEDKYSDIEHSLAEIFKRTLGFEEININDSFFDLGGDSILLNRMLLEIQDQYPGQVTVADLFSHSSISKLAKFLSNEEFALVKKKDSTFKNYDKTEPIAIIGMACQLPLAENTAEFWQNTLHGVDCIRRIPSQRRKDLESYWSYTKGQEPQNYLDLGFLERIDEFDYGFFNVSPKEGELTDPAHRLFLQTAWHALEDAGYGGDTLYGSTTGVYLGFATIMKDSYQKIIYDINPMLIPRSIVGNVAAMMPSRISYLLNLKGPSMVIDTACSSTLVTTHMACNAIRNGDCNMAIAGGVKLFLTPYEDDNMKIGIESSDGRTRAFSEGSDGAGMGEGVGAIVLKPLSKAIEDKDRIHGVIIGSAINQDGASMGITAPSPEAQTEVIIKAWEQAGIKPSELAHIETHGTGTALGDPIEIQALGNAFKAYGNNRSQVAISSVKSQIGHLNECAGIVGLIKTLKILKEKTIPPTSYFGNPNTKIEFPYSPVYLNTYTRKWDNVEGVMKCAISSFGFSGTNCHMVVEEAPQRQYIESREVYPMLTVSAKSLGSLKALVIMYGDFIRMQPKERLASICYTQNSGRGHYSYRAAIIFMSKEDLVEKLEKLMESIEGASLNPENVWWGYNKVVSGEKVKEYELTTQKKRELDFKISKYMEDLDVPSEQEKINALGEIAALYVKGADIKWETFYNNIKYQKCDLPLYPFEKNRCWIEIEGKESKYNDGGLYQISWIPVEKNLTIQNQEQQILILINNNPYTLRLKEELDKTLHNVTYLKVSTIDGKNVIYQRTNGERVELKDVIETEKIKKVIDLSYITIGEEVISPESIAFMAAQNIQQYRQRLMSLNNITYISKLQYILVTDHTFWIEGVQCNLKPQNATLIGFSRGMDKEIEQISHVTVDIDGNTDIEVVVQYLCAESMSYAVVLRNGIAYQESFREVEDEDHAKPLVVSSDGVYIITGGTGGIGTEIALNLAEKGSVNIALLGRSKLSQMEQLNNPLEKYEHEKIPLKLERLSKIKERCNTLEYYSVDFNDYQSLETIVTKLRNKYGRINGVIHGAGVPGSGFFEEITSDKLQNVLLPKVQGTCFLDKLTREDNLQFFVMFSSVATIVEAVGQADYIAANAFLDAYSGYMKQLGIAARTINWSTWKEVGMAKDAGFIIDTAFKALDINRAIQGFNQAMRLAHPRVLIGQINFNSKMARQILNKGLILPEKILVDFQQSRKEDKALDFIKKGKSKNPVKLIGRGTGNYTYTEITLAEICRELLGFEVLDIHEHFFELGADSILIKQMYLHIQDRFDIEISITDLFEYPNIAKLGSYIENIIEKEQSQIKAHEKNNNEELNSMIEAMQKGELDIDYLVNTIMDTKGV